MLRQIAPSYGPGDGQAIPGSPTATSASTRTGANPNPDPDASRKDLEKALKRLKRKLERAGLFKEMKRRRHFEKPSERKRRKTQEAERRRRKKLRKDSERV